MEMNRMVEEQSVFESGEFHVNYMNKFEQFDKKTD